MHEHHLVGLGLHALLGDAQAVRPLRPPAETVSVGLRQGLHHLAGRAVEHLVVRRAGGADGRRGARARRARARAARRAPAVGAMRRGGG